MPAKKTKFEKLEIPGVTSLEKSLLLSIPGGLSNACKPKMEQLPPPSVLDRLQSFLPALDKANAALAQQPAGVANLELEDSDDQPHIALDLACGLFDLKSKEAAERAELLMKGVQAQPEGQADTESTSSSDSDLSESSETDSGEDIRHSTTLVPCERKLEAGDALSNDTREEIASRKRKRTAKVQEI